MLSSSHARLLAVWEQGAELTPAARAWLLLRAHDPELSESALTRLSVGDADRRLLAMRSSAFGDRFDAVSRCPACDEPIELEFGAEDFPPVSDTQAAEEGRRLSSGGVRVEYRLPTLGDLAAAARASDPQAARATVVERCITRVTRNGGRRADLSAEVVSAVGQALEAADPMAGSRLELRCPACDHAWAIAFDVGAYLWAELDAWAERMLREVHLLARAYGWREADILALSSRRRRAYLELVLE
jgi:hypothetical protein